MTAEARAEEARRPMPLLPEEADVVEAVQQGRADVFLVPWLTRVQCLLEEGEVRGVAALVDRLLSLCGVRPGTPPWHQIEVGRSVRYLVARCMVLVYRTDAPKPPLFEVMGLLRDVFAADIPTPAHVAAMHVSRELVRAFPRHVGSQSAAIPLCLRLIRPSSHTVVVRFYALRLLACLTPPPAMLKDVLKVLKSGLSDKAGAVVRGCAACLEALAPTSRAEIEAWLALVVKSIHGVDAHTRASLARLAAVLLCQTASSAAADEGKDPVVQPVYAVSEQLHLLYGHLSRASTQEARTEMLSMYDALLTRHGSAWLEQHLDVVYTHLVQEIATRLPNGAELVRRLLDPHWPALSEPAQERAAAYLGTHVLAMWPPSTPTQPVPSEAALCVTLDATAVLVAQLGELSATLHEALYEVHRRLLTHPALAVQVRAAWWLSVACSVQPWLLAPTYAELLGCMRRDTEALSKPQHDRGVSLRARLVGHSAALAALARVAAQHPLYMRNDDVDEVCLLAMDLRTRYSETPAAPHASAAVGSAWMLVGSLMALGPEFLRAQVPTLLHAWRQAWADRPWREMDEGAYLVTERLGALSSMHAFFLHGGHALLTPETARRLVALQSQALAFLAAWERRAPGTSEASLLRARMLRCCTHLAQAPAMETLAPALLRLCVEWLTRAEYASPSGAAPPVHAPGATPWTVQDGVAMGVTSLLAQDRVALDAWTPSFVSAQCQAGPRVGTPVSGALEHDTMALYALPVEPDAGWGLLPRAPEPMPAHVAEVDAAAELFAALFPFACRDVQIGASEGLLTAQRRPALDKQPGRRMAVMANSVVALLGAVRTAAQPVHRASGFANERINAAIRGVAQTALQQGPAVLRRAAAELYGYLASLAGSVSLSAQVACMVEQIGDARHADARAACVLALGEMYARLGGLRAAPLTKSVHTLALSLAHDPHPAVHCCALEALASVAEAAGVAYEPYVESTLRLMTRLCAAATHEPEGGSVGSSNLRVHLPAYPGVARVLSALVGVLGPDLQAAEATRHWLYALLLHLAHDGGDAVPEAIVGLQRLELVVPSMLATRVWADVLRDAVQQPRLAPTAAGAYGQMAQRGSAWLARYGGPSLLVTLLRQLDAHPHLDGIRALIGAWLRDTAPMRPCAWMDLCCTVLLTPEALRTQRVAGAGGDVDEAAMALAPHDTETQALSVRWRTQRFVLTCMHDVLACVHTRAEHVGRGSDARDRRVLSSRVSDMLRAACSASTATHRAVRSQGLQVLRDVLESFAETPDPDFGEARLLEQFQAQLTAALTAAWGADTPPDVRAAAIAVSGVYLSAGIDASPTSRMGRRMVSALEGAPSADASLTAQAAAYVHVAVIRAWARMALTPGLATLVAPHVPTLARAWVHMLTAYATLRADRTASVASAWLSPDSALAPLVQAHMRGTLAQAYPTLLQALTSVFASHPDVVQAALAQDLGDARRAFMALYGLALETLWEALDRPAAPSLLSVVLRSLHVLVDVRYSGSFLLQDAPFDELVCVCQRALLGTDTAVQRGVVQLIRAMVRSMRERLLLHDDGTVQDMPSSKLGRLWRLLSHVMELLPSQPTPRTERATLLQMVWCTLADMIAVGSASLQLELVAVSLHMLVAYARREDEAAWMLTPALSVLREICAAACASAHADANLAHRAVQGFLSAMIDMSDALRARSGDMVSRRSGHALVSASLVLTHLDASITISSEVTERLAFLLAQKLDTDDDAPIALQCLRSMVHAQPPRHSLHLCLGACLPSLVAHALRTHADAALDVLVALVHVMPPDAALRVCVPVAVTYLERPAPSPHVVHAVVELARTHADAFRTATRALDDDARTRLQQTFRTAIGAPAAPTAAPSGEGRIALRTFGAAEWRSS